VDKWTLVQHSGFGYGGNPEFRKAVETRSLSKAAEVKKVKAAGGVVLDSYGSASDREFDENYPEEVQGLVPHCRGTFAKTEIDGLKIYIPAEKKE
jgi:hypothetical protein